MADSSKTEKPTPKRREKARQQGQVARSRELPGVLAIVGIAGALTLMTGGAATHWTNLYRNTLDAAATGDLQSNGPILFWNAVEVLRWIVPLLLVGLLLSVVAGVAQGGINLAPEALQLKFERFSPSSKLKQIFSPVGLSNLLKSLIPFSLILWFGIRSLESNWRHMIQSNDLGVRPLAALVGSMALEVGWKAAAVLFVWSGVDYFLTWQKMEGDLRMSREEIKKEYKESDGNPVIKNRIRRLQRSMRRTQSLKAASTATLVITNPTHFAVALRYEPDMPAPLVVAKGADLLAQKIKEIARENNVTIMENKPLAQALYKSVEVGDAIPADLYQAVAEILVVLFRAQAEVRAQDTKSRSRNAAGEVIIP